MMAKIHNYVCDPPPQHYTRMYQSTSVIKWNGATGKTLVEGKIHKLVSNIAI